MRETFELVKPHLLKHEGGYVDHPRDPGGATNMGITQRTLSAWRGQPVSKEAVKNLKRDEALKIYKAQYWDAVKGDLLPAGLDYSVYDFAVNSGPARAVKTLQRIVGVAPDGILGAITLNAIRKRDTKQLIEMLNDERLAFMKRLSTWRTFGKGWSRRVADVRRVSLDILGNTVRDPIDQPSAPEKARDSDKSPLEVWKTPEGIATGVGALSGLSAILADAPILQYTLAGMLLIGTGTGAYYFLHRLREG